MSRIGFDLILCGFLYLVGTFSVLLGLVSLGLGLVGLLLLLSFGLGLFAGLLIRLLRNYGSNQHDAEAKSSCCAKDLHITLLRTF